MRIGNNDPIEVILYTIYSRSTKKTTPTPVRKPQVKVRCYTARYPVLGIVQRAYHRGTESNGDNTSHNTMVR